MNEIPDDIKAAARKAIWDTGRGMIGRERNYLEYRVQRAILVERERCAKVAEEVGKGASRSRDIYVMTGAAGLSRVIATAIRMPPGAALATPEE